MSGRKSRNKGSGGEREVKDILATELGLNLSRTPRSGAWEHAKGDIYGVPGFSIECKRQERTRIEEWYQQSLSDAKEGEIPLLVYRQSRKPWKVVLSLEDFLEMMKIYIDFKASEAENGLT